MHLKIKWLLSDTSSKSLPDQCMRIKVINPNTTTSMTEKIATVASAVASPGTDIIACSPETGPTTIEGHYDEALSVIGVLDEVSKGEADGVDGYVIACFGDPGLLAARELAIGPVLGIAEAAMHTATFIATGFSIVTSLDRTRIMAQQLVETYGMTRSCRNIRAVNLPVLSVADPIQAQAAVLKECQTAIQEDHCGAIVLGCSGMTDLAAPIRRELGIPVVDGVGAAVKLMEVLIGLGLHTSKVGDLASPIPKPYLGILSRFTRQG
jgi:allantoin racemase